jgi:hypothetical protein
MLIGSSETTPDQIVAACREAGVRLVRFLYCDCAEHRVMPTRATAGLAGVVNALKLSA